MEMTAAVFRKVHEPLTIESVDIDKPWGREVLVRTATSTSSMARGGGLSIGPSCWVTRGPASSRPSARR
jgi:hypothetical protein